MKRFTSQELHAVPPAPRRALLLDAFDALAVGNAFEIVSDHALTPIQRMLEEQRPGHVAWHDIETGPPRWLVRVERKE
jgi:uncharacterized protein (DUF2249 family)